MMTDFDYEASAELYVTNRQRGGVTFQRFNSAAKAIRHSIEGLPVKSFPGTILEVGNARFQHKEIRKLYDSSAYPLRRRTEEKSDAA